MNWLILTLAYFVIAVVFYVILSRSVAGNGVLKFMASGSVAGLALIVHGLKLPSPSDGVPAALLYAFICELFIFTFTAMRNSVAMSLLLVLKKRPLPDNEIDKLYADQEMVQWRIKNMLKIGLLGPHAAGPALTSRGRLFLNVFRLCKRFFRHERPERSFHT